MLSLNHYFPDCCLLQSIQFSRSNLQPEVMLKDKHQNIFTSPKGNAVYKNKLKKKTFVKSIPTICTPLKIQYANR